MARCFRSLLVLLALLSATRAEAVVAHVQTVQGGSSSLGTTVSTGSFSTTAGNLLICAVVGFLSGNPSDISTVATSTPQSLSLARRATKAENQGNEIWYVANLSGGSITVTATYASSLTFKSILCTEVSGAATSSPLDGAGVDANGNSTSCSTGSYSATSTSFWFASCAASSSGSFSVGGSWTIPTNGSTTGDEPGAVAYYANPGSGSQTATFTIGSSGWIANGVAFLVAGAGGAGPPLGTLSLLGVGR